MGLALCLVAAALGASALLGALLELPWLLSIIPRQRPMSQNSALALVLLGVGAALRFDPAAPRWTRLLSGAAALVVLAMGFLTLAEYLLQIDLRTDHILGSVAPGLRARPSPPSALAFSLLAAALLVFDLRLAPRLRPTEWLAVPAGLVAYIALLGISFGAGPIYRVQSLPIKGVAISTAIGLFLLVTGMLLERPGAGVMSLVLSPGPGGMLIRRLVPATVIAPIFLKVVLTRYLAGEGVVDVPLTFAGLVASATLLALSLLLVIAPRLNQAHEALELNRARTQLLLEQAPDGILVTDLEGRYREVNSAACRMTGYSREELLEKTIPDLLPPSEVARLWEARHQLLGGGVQLAEWTMIKKDGSELHVEASATILPDGRWQAIVRDIGERKRAQDELRESRERLTLALRGATLGSWDWNIRTGSLVFDQRFAEMRGFRVEEVDPHIEAWKTAIHPEDRPQVEHALADHFLGDTSEYEAEFRVRTKGGDWIWVLDRGKVFEHDELGHPLRMLGTASDVTTRKQIDQELRLAEARSAGLLAISADAIISIDEEQRITLFNDGAERILGYARSEVIGEPLDILIPERFRAKHREHVERFAAGGVIARRMGGPGIEIVGLRKNGEEFPADAFISKLEVGGKRILTVALRDVTEQKRLEENLRLAAQTRDEVMGIVAHDLRNPLGIILMTAQLLREGRNPDRRSRRPINVIERAATRMKLLIEDLLDLTRIEAGRFTIECGDQDPMHILGEVLEAQRPLAVSASLDLLLDAPHDLPPVSGDHARLVQVFENLIGNALKFTEAGGQVTLGAAQKEREVLFWVADTGAGIATDNLPFVFDRFWQARKGEIHGAGLGLPIVKGIVEAHGGRVWVESAPGRGSTFFFTVPMSEAQREGHNKSGTRLYG